MGLDEQSADRGRDEALALLRSAKPLLERFGERIAAAEIALLIARLEAEPQVSSDRSGDMWEIVIP